MDRASFRQLARTRLEDAKALRDAGRFGAAFYLAGYAVECALKACISKQTVAEAFPPKNAQKLYTHNLTELVTLAGLRIDLDNARAADSDLKDNWNVVILWNEEARYEAHTQQEAHDLIAAIDDANHGVLTWLSGRW